MVVILIVGGEPSSPSPLFTPSTTVSIISSGSQVSPDDQLATTKEEEWIKRKKVEVVTKRQIATRVQREVVLEDGKVVQDSGPKVTTTTTEDTEKQESENTEHHDIGDGGGGGGDVAELGWVATGDPAVHKEVREKKITSREEKQETVETEDVKHLGDISDEAYKQAIGSCDVGGALVRSPGLELARLGPRLVGQTTRIHRLTDTEDTVKTTGIDHTGQIVTNTTTTKEHEEVKEEDIPEGENSEEDFNKEKTEHYRKTKEEEFVDYLANGVKIGTEMRYNAETTEGTRLGEGEWDSLSQRLNKMRRGRLLKEAEHDRKDAITRCPLDFDQEEKTRKAETSKWLENHFGSESASRSSRESDEDTPQTSFINVTMKSTKDNKQTGKVFLASPEPERLYFKGVSEWKSDERRGAASGSNHNGPARIQVLPTGPHQTFNTSSKSPSPSYTKTPSPALVNGAHRNKSPSPPFNGVKFPSTQNLERNASPSHVSHNEKFTKTTKYFSQERTSSPYGRTTSPMYNGHRTSPVHHNGKITPNRDHTPNTVSPPPRRRNRKIERQEESVREEPAPDYSPVSEPRSSPHRVTPDPKRKIYQRTRFAADIPPPPQQPTKEGKGSKEKEGKRGGLGQSFRRLVGKLRSGSGERKKKGKKTSGGDDEEGRVVDSGTQTANDMTTVHRYYLGEDPFGGSIYGKESEYDGVTYRRKYRREEDTRQHSSSQGSSTLGRLSKSTGRLSGERSLQNGTTVHYHTDRGGVQTLPRKLQEHKMKKEVEVTRMNGERRTPTTDRYRLGQNSSSMFNVSIVNNIKSGSYLNGSTGPAKPARTYKSNLLRSKSFNVQAGDRGEGGRYRSNPQLHRLDEAHPPLKSPGIVTSISRSTRDIGEALHEEDSRRPLADRNRYLKSPSRTHIDNKKKIFMKGLMERAPELYQKLHGNEVELSEETRTRYNNGSNSPLPANSYANSPSGTDLNRSLVRRGSNDYTETVRYTTKSDDPLRPSVTDTLQSFTKKTLPALGGRKETIQSTETKTVTKSRFRSGTPDLKYLDNDNKYSTSNGGVIIEVRNTRK